LNIQKQGLSFDEAKTMFGDDVALIQPDIKHSQYEERFLIIERANSGEVLVRSHTIER
jgi:uncharacterized protein